MNLLNLLQSHIVSPDDRNEKIAVVDITPELATHLLEVNFANNRAVSWEHVKRMAADMKNGLWVLGNDAVCVDVFGNLINANHRMNAVKASKTTQRFVVMWDLPRETAQLMDVGRKRTMHERITISGCAMNSKECSITRNAMNDYSKTVTGTIEYGYQNHDDIVKKYYCFHSEFLKAADARRASGASFIKSAALKLYVEMTHYRHRHVFRHNMTALERSLLFVDLVQDGYSNNGLNAGPHEISALKLKNLKDRRTSDQRDPYWISKESLRYTISMAYKFMTGEFVENVSKYKTDPFSSFLDAPSTNAGGNESA